MQLETLLVSQPGSGEEAMHITEMLIKSNAVDIIVIDSVAALVPKKELEGEIGDSHVGLQARPMSQSMRKLTGIISEVEDVGDLHQPDPREDRRDVRQSRDHARRPGVEVLLLLPHRRAAHQPDQGGRGGDRERVRAKVVKNKVAPPFRVAEFDMMHDHGISYESDMLDLAMAQKLVTRTGAWFRYGDVQLGQGREKVRDYLKDNPKLVEELKEKIMAAGPPPPPRWPPNRRSRRKNRRQHNRLQLCYNWRHWRRAYGKRSRSRSICRDRAADSSRAKPQNCAFWQPGAANIARTAISTCW